ncbi:hypothetical protein CLV46_0938 [Diaminobutyricimonas aerilata]|uniref:DUF3137 domain-containing protein n=1 Tax=Diaminobutyricimonas aerilata TaxID=1162967 RepID=A0A2M9CHP4_9MICO|nr:hypothetical protein [Diaminobutyricimonas aerilata]PJJ71392.1 hypothetical protein CLV46_0938 [Diaminobutyricimonas aerilata]
MARVLDTTPLTEPIDRRRLAEFVASVRRDPRYVYWRLSYPGCSLVLLGGALLVLSGFFALMAAVFIEGESQIDSPGDWVTFAVAMLVMAAIYVGCAIGFVSLVANPVQSEELYRLHRFAERNGLRFSPQDPAPAYPIEPFAHPKAVVRDRFRPLEGDAFDYGLAFRPSQGRSDASYSRWFIAIKLDRPLPHIVLDAKANNSRVFGSNMPTLQRDQVLSLEGDFDKHFTLYCPKGYERDALYIFTPDLMAACIDEANAFDVEILDQWMFVYSLLPPNLVDPAVQRRIFRIIDIVGAKALSRTDRYRDERAGGDAPAVALPGRRLRAGVSIAAVVGVLVICTAPFWGEIINGVTGN